MAVILVLNFGWGKKQKIKPLFKKSIHSFYSIYLVKNFGKSPKLKTNSGSKISPPSSQDMEWSIPLRMYSEYSHLTRHNCLLNRNLQNGISQNCADNMFATTNKSNNHCMHQTYKLFIFIIHADVVTLSNIA
jgi:hypothetical protein